jgi:hypothetical protein
MEIDVASSPEISLIGGPTVSVEIVVLCGRMQMNEKLLPMTRLDFFEQFRAH